mmetsp:Transcript_31196/g.61529  ORF Transcript_31196/g.61529 Transcript_31196/m.61529 type:complete len:91 (+) Transcript_31196:725-997(+)
MTHGWTHGSIRLNVGQSEEHSCCSYVVTMTLTLVSLSCTNETHEEGTERQNESKKTRIQKSRQKERKRKKVHPPTAGRPLHPSIHPSTLD